jgi:hypothetical protein
MMEHPSEQWIIDYMGTLERLVRMMEEASRWLNPHVDESSRRAARSISDAIDL